jgi:hypothetical protein
VAVAESKTEVVKLDSYSYINPASDSNKLSIKLTLPRTRMKRQLLLLALITLYVIGAEAQQKLPPKLLRNWLSPNTNEWVFGITNKYVFTNGTYWNYKVVGVKNHQYKLALNQKGLKKTLYAKLVGENTAKLGYTTKSTLNYSSKINEQANYGLHNEEGFKRPLVRAGTVHLKGVLKGYNRRLDNYRYINLNFQPLLASSQITYAIPVDSLGRFSFNFRISNSQEVFFVFWRPGRRVFCYA